MPHTSCAAVPFISTPSFSASSPFRVVHVRAECVWVCVCACVRAHRLSSIIPLCAPLAVFPQGRPAEDVADCNQQLISGHTKGLQCRAVSWGSLREGLDGIGMHALLEKITATTVECAARKDTWLYPCTCFLHAVRDSKRGETLCCLALMPMYSVPSDSGTRHGRAISWKLRVPVVQLVVLQALQALHSTNLNTSDDRLMRHLGISGESYLALSDIFRLFTAPLRKRPG